jgi:hypothetical protein
MDKPVQWLTWQELRDELSGPARPGRPRIWMTFLPTGNSRV